MKVMQKNMFRRLLTFSLIGMIATILASCDDNKNNDSEVKVEADISYVIAISPDLLKFVTPQVKYVDENGNIVTLTGVEDLDGKVMENKAEIIDGNSKTIAWTYQVIAGTGEKCWTIKMKFNRLNFHSYLGVKYIRNDFIEDTTGKIYNFLHNVRTSINVIKTVGTASIVNQDSHIPISLGDYNTGDDIEKYLQDLYKTPDKVGYFIDEDGNVSRRDDFSF